MQTFSTRDFRTGRYHEALADHARDVLRHRGGVLRHTAEELASVMREDSERGAQLIAALSPADRYEQAAAHVAYMAERGHQLDIDLVLRRFNALAE